MLGSNPSPGGARLDKEGQMSAHCCPRAMFALLLVSVSLVVGPSFSWVVAAGARSQPVASIGHNQGNPHAVPPILPPATPSELAVIRQVEAQEAVAIAYHPLASAEYSLAALHRYGRAGRLGS
jgi:hypothetical protein